MAGAIVLWTVILFVVSSPIVMGYQNHRRALGRPEAPGKMVRLLMLAVVWIAFGIILLVPESPHWHEGADTRPETAVTAASSILLAVACYAVGRVLRRKPESLHTAWLGCLLRDLLFLCLGCFALVVVEHWSLLVRHIRRIW